MSDFSELCPLFNTGVFSEVTFPDIAGTGLSKSANGLLGTLICGSATRTAVWTFGRTVIVTDAFVRNRVKLTLQQFLKLQHYATLCAAGSEIGTLTISITADGIETYSWMPMSVTDRTFTSNAILGLSFGTSTANGGGTYDLIVRYKEA